MLGAGGRSDNIASALRWACEVEVRAPKPGNVSVAAPGHGMTASDFLASAAAAAAPLARPGAGVGERILAAVEATRSAVHCNTNLGIILLAAPLSHAALAAADGRELRSGVERVLAGLTIADAELAYRAIRLANPGGLGSAERHDVSEAPTVTLLTGMREAWQRDSIARQYATGYWDVFEHGAPLFRACARRWDSPEWAAVAVYLDFLVRFPDSHIARKAGPAEAARVSREAAPFAIALQQSDNPEQMARRMLEWDSRLKQQGHNPGTSADLTVASMLAVRLQDLLEQELTDRAPGNGARGNSTGDRSRTLSTTL